MSPPIDHNFANEADFLAHYNIKNYEVPLVSVDIAIFTLHQNMLKVLLVNRTDYPAKGDWALPGGFIQQNLDDTLAECALRKLQQKTGVTTPYLEQIQTVGNATRDPRGWSVTTVYFAFVVYQPFANNASSSQEPTEWFDVEQVKDMRLAFDHQQLLSNALQRIRSKVLYTLIPAHLIASPFTLSNLQSAYEIILGKPLEKKAFRRRLDTADVIEATGAFSPLKNGRPAALFTLKPQFSQFNFVRQLHGGQ